MARTNVYYYVWNHKRWCLFATLIHNEVIPCTIPMEHPLSGIEEIQEISTPAGYIADTNEAYGFRFLAVIHTSIFRFRPTSNIKKAINIFAEKQAEWRRQLLDFLVITDVNSEFKDIVKEAQKICGSKYMLVGFLRSTQSFVFELPEENLSYDDRIIVISSEENPNKFYQLFNIEDSLDFWMPSKFGKSHYCAYKLIHRDKFLGVILIDQENLSELNPFININHFIQVLSNFFMVVQSKQLYNGRELISGLFKSDQPIETHRVNSLVKKLIFGQRIPWIDYVCDLIARFLKVDACTVFWKHIDPRLFLAGSTHCKEKQQMFYNLNVQSLTTKCYNSDTPICVTDVGNSSENSHLYDEDIPELHKSWLGYPIKAKGDRIGVLRLLNKRSPNNRLTYFSQTDIENAYLVSNYLAKCYEEFQQYSQMYKAKNDALGLKLKAEKAEKSTSRFMKSLTHEIQRPIPSIGGLLEYLEIVLGKSSLNEKDDIALKIKDCWSCLDLLQVILNTIVHHSGEVSPNYTEINLVEDLLQPLGRMLMPAARDEKKEFIYVAHCKHQWITIDKTLTTQILVILLLNAFKYADDNTEVILTVNDVHQGIEFQVEDKGEVIPLDCVDRIFEWEYRAPTIVTKRYPGAGIGLSLAQTIARALKTKIYLKKRYPKTIFTFRLRNGGD